MDKITLDPEIQRSFHLFWDNFPSPVMLVYKDRTILARNKAAGAVPGCSPGERCSNLGDSEAHKRCQAGRALSEGVAQRSVDYIPHMGMVIDSYWIPLEGYEGIYIHFGLDITEYAAERYFHPGADQV